MVAPLIAALPFMSSSVARLAAFTIYVIAALSDYYDGMLARTRDLVTDLGRMLDPLADKLLLFATLIPMYILMAPGPDPFAPTTASLGGAHGFPFRTPWGSVGLAWWVVAVVIARELLMTVFRQVAARKGVVIGAIGPAKWKTGFQCIWVGAAYFWFFAATYAGAAGLATPAWTAWSYVNGVIGVIAMIAAVALTIYSLWLYIVRYGRVITG
jgi:CDP-diacylglycerol---glycerol-3-phosphate 3-phosphatidyltransferase